MMLPQYLQYCYLFMKRKELIVGECLLRIFNLSSLPRSSFVSVVFDFNASLNDVAPLSPIMLSGDMKRERKRVNC